MACSELALPETCKYLGAEGPRKKLHLQENRSPGDD